MPEPLDLTHDPHYTGGFAPVHDELDTDELVVEGKIPPELSGAYLRNGMNPKYPPILSYTFPLDGDAMVHGVWLDHGRARYRNRWVRTRQLAHEDRAGRALYGGILTPALPVPALTGGDTTPFKDSPMINIVCHAGNLLALAEGSPPYKLAADLATIGPWDFGGRLPDGITAHPKIDPVSGELVVFRYGLEKPFLTWGIVDARGTVTHAPDTIELDGAYMIHDFAITPDYAVIFVCPLAFDLGARGGVLQWRPERGTRIALVPRSGTGGHTRWLETGPFWVWHFGNAYQEGDEIVVLYAHWDRLDFGGHKHGPNKGQVRRARLHPGRGTVRYETVDERPAEFPRIDDRRMGRKNRYLHLSQKSNKLDVPGSFDRIVRYDLETGRVQERTLTRAWTGEVAFAPSPGSEDENDGYLMSFHYLMDSDGSDFVIYRAGDLEGGPVATVHMPRRVSGGLHGNWITGCR
jgi:carotenoid cleavage dioxygenase